MSERLKEDRAHAVKGKDQAVDATAPKKTAKPPKEVLVIFLLNKDGHRRMFAEDYPKADELFRRSLLYAARVKAEVAAQPDPPVVEVQTFNSFNDLIRQRPKARGAKWSAVILLTHGSAQIEQAQTRSGLWLGDRHYFAQSPDPDSVIFGAMARANQQTLKAFQESFRPDAEVMVAACGLGQTPVEAGEFMRDVFTTDGVVAIPNVRVGLDKRTGELGSMEDDENPEIKKLTNDDWTLIPAR